MARKANYKEKISALEAKIEKKQSEIKALKAKHDYQELTEYMRANDLTAAEVLACIKD